MVNGKTKYDSWQKKAQHSFISAFYERPDADHLVRSLEVTLLRRNLIVSCGSRSIRGAINLVASDLQANIISGSGVGL